MVIRHRLMSVEDNSGFRGRHGRHFAHANFLLLSGDRVHDIVARMNFVNLAWRHTFF